MKSQTSTTETFVTVDGTRIITMRDEGDTPGFTIRHPDPWFNMATPIVLTTEGARGLAAALLEQADAWDRCPTCGCELAHPTAPHIVDCPLPVTSHE